MAKRNTFRLLDDDPGLADRNRPMWATFEGFRVPRRLVCVVRREIPCPALLHKQHPTCGGTTHSVTGRVYRVLVSARAILSSQRVR